MDKIEKERKFLLKRVPHMQWDNNISIWQYYHEGYRYRYSITGTDIKTESFERIKKIKIDKGVNNETEITVMTREVFEVFRDKAKREGWPSISKIRYVKHYRGKTFEVDSFMSVNMSMMEVEDVEMDTVIEFPPELEKVMVMEVTGMEEFDNFNLAK